LDDIRIIMEKIYRDHNPEKISNVPGILEKYKGNEAEMLTKLSHKYNLQLEEYITVDYLNLVKEILTRHDPVNASSAVSLLANYYRRENELLKVLRDKFSTGFNDIIISFYTTPPPEPEPAVIAEKKLNVSPTVVLSKVEAKQKKSRKTLAMVSIGSIVVIVALALVFMSGVLKSRKADNVVNKTAPSVMLSVNTLVTNTPVTNPPATTPSTPPPSEPVINVSNTVTTSTQESEKVNPFGAGNGKLTIFKTCNSCSDVKISIDGNYAGTLTQNFNSGTAKCDENGTISRVLSTGRHHVSGEDSNGTTWDIMVSVQAGKCVMQEIGKKRDG